MPVHQLRGTWIKIERAKEHIGNLEREIAAFKDRHPYTIVAERNAETGEKIHRFELLEPIPPVWGALLGDAIHNLRSALDILVNELVIANGGKTTDATGFPICKDLKAFRSDREREKLRGLSNVALEIIDDLKPYKGGLGLFWVLHRLDIADKHRLVIPVGIAQSHLTVTLSAAGEVIGYPLTLQLPSPRFPIEGGTEIMREPAGPAGQIELDAKYDATLDVAFGEGEIVRGQPIVPALSQIADFVSRLVIFFEDRVFGQSPQV